MDIQTVKELFMWMTIINGGLYFFSAFMCMFCLDWAFKMHSKFFPISREAFNTIIYTCILFYKLVFFIFFLIPYIALVIVA